MYLKRYTIASILLMVIVGWYVYAFVTQGSFALEFLGVQFPEMSIAVLVIIPLAIFYLASLLHMGFYSILAGLESRKYDKDYEKYIDSVVEAYLGKQVRNHTYKTDRYKLLGGVMDNSVLMANQTLVADTSNEKINNIINIINDVKDGKVVDLKKFNLKITNELVILNQRNMYKNGDISAEDILSSKDRYCENIVKDVYIDFVKTAPLYAIENYKKFISKEALFEVLARINADEETLEISNESLIALFKELELEAGDYLKISAILSKSMIPEQRIKLFETLSEENEDATGAYLYTLFDLEMISPADELLQGTQPNEYLNFKSYRALKDCGKNFSIELFV